MPRASSDGWIEYTFTTLVCTRGRVQGVYSLLVAHLKLRKEKLLLKNISPIQRQSLELLVRQLPFQLDTGR